MALTTCPECKEKISTTADQCIHCGCKLQSCPECGMVLMKGTETCPECGYTFVRKVHDEQPKKEQFKEEQPQKEQPKKQNTQEPKQNPFALLISGWKKVSGALVLLDIMDNITFALSMLGIVATFIIGFFVIKNTDAEATIFILVICWFLIYPFDILHDIFSTIKPLIRSKSLWSFAQKNQFSIQECTTAGLTKKVASMESSEKRKHLKNVQTAMNAHYYHEVSGAVPSSIFLGIIDSIIDALSTPFLVGFIIINIENVMEARTFLAFDVYECFWMLILAVVLFVVKKIISKTVEKKQEEKKDAWMKEQYADVYAKYLAYLDQ